MIMLRSEADFLALIDELFPAIHAHMPLGRGDDCAVLACPERMCMTSDLFLQDAHFRTSYFAPGDVGYKALAASVSDVASMGARPLGFNLQLFGPRDIPGGYWRGVLSGMAELANSLDLPLTGGDLSLGPVVGLGVTMWGRAVCGRFLTREAEPGDVLFMVGLPGLARVGLTLLEEDGPRHDYPVCVAAHLRPRALLDAAERVAGVDAVRGLMDVSDGLAMDVPRLLGLDRGDGSRAIGADMDLSGVLHPEVCAFATATGQHPEFVAWLGGEDYALLGAVRSEGVDALHAAVPEAHVIGRVTDQPGLRLSGEPAPDHGFDHFSA